MPTKKEQPRRRSLNDRLDAELSASDSIPVAGINSTEEQHTGAETSLKSENIQKPIGSTSDAEFPTKKATTIMPKEVFSALQHYCTDTDTPKHRALYLFIIDGLHAKGVITDDDYQRFRDMATRLTTTYEKK